MSWREDLRPASWRGVSFYVERADDVVGRKTSLHKYVQRDTAWQEDLGKDASEYTLDAFVIGNDYMVARDRLREALLQPGLGELVHPYWGTLQLAVDGRVRIAQSTRNGGMATFNIRFVESDEKTYPTAISDTRRSVASEATLAESTLAASFAAAFDVLKSADFVATEASAVLSEAIDTINDAASSIISAGSEMTRFVGLIEEMESSVARLVRAPETLAQKLIGSIGGLLLLNDTDDTTSQPYRAPMRSAVALTSFGEDLAAVSETTPSRATQAQNQTALTSLVRRAGIVAAARAAADIDFTSYDDAVSVRDELSELFENEIVLAGDAGDDAAFDALALVRTAMMEDITARGAVLSRLGTFTPDVTMPAFLIAYQLYGDASRADEIVARNNIIHPGFVPGGVALEVLLDA
ncbi:MAG: hypothetical protein GC184_14600 [Rhizobiales bacterium]|nr:hypothetical protein [Hyphomicrobiales bacterium]